MTTIYRIKDYETDWTSKWNEDKDAVIKQLDDYVDSYLGDVVLGSFVVIQSLVLEDIDARFVGFEVKDGDGVTEYVEVDEVYQWNKNKDEVFVLVKVDKNELVEQSKVILQVLAKNKKTKRFDDLKNRRAIMDKDEMNKFIENIGRCELYEEIQDSKLRRGDRGKMQWNGYPRYIKAIRVSLVEMGYDERWVDTKFRDAIEKKYLGY